MPRADAELALKQNGSAKANVDPSLHSQRRYAAFLAELRIAGMLKGSEVAGVVQVRVFAVQKKNIGSAW